MEGIKLLKEAVMFEAEMVSPGGSKKAPAGKAPPAKGKGAVDAGAGEGPLYDLPLHIPLCPCITPIYTRTHIPPHTHV